jgi:nitrite reductase (NO-forming)
MYSYIFTELLGWLIVLALAVFLIYKIWALLRHPSQSVASLKHHQVVVLLSLLGLIMASGLIFFSRHPHPLNFAMPLTMHAHTPDKGAPSLPLASLVNFFRSSSNFERIPDIGADPNAVPPPITRAEPAVVHFSITTQEVISEVYAGVYNNYWTYDGQVPGPMLRVMVGDTVHMQITNHPSSIHPHNIDLHSVTGPGGGAAVTNVQPGETKSFTWKALAPGLYIYHCATPNVSVHNSHGQYGLILVEPEEGLPPVDKEFYVVQGELYTQGGLGRKGLLAFDSQALLDGIPSYITFNGRVESTPRMKAKVGDRIRMYVGNGGVGLISSFHVIGEVFDRVYPEGAMGQDSAIFENVQTTAVLPGGSVVVEFTVDVPGKYVLVDHALSRMNKGAWAVLEVDGAPRPEIFSGISDGSH